MQDELIKLRTEIDTDEASVSLESLKGDLREVKRELKEMGPVSEEWSDAQKEAYTELRNKQRELNSEIREYTRNIDLNDASMGELNARARQLQGEFRQLKVGSEEWLDKLREINQVNNRISDVKEEMDRLSDAMNDQKGLIGRWKDEFVGTFLAISFDDIIDGVADFGRESIEMGAKTTDVFADIQKSTGLSADEVERLNDILKNIDTRTAQEALQDIVKVGGQLGIATDEIEGFTVSVDKANVALGDEFSGGAEEVAGVMGTLAKLFEDTKNMQAGDAINDIGSAINELGAAGSATGPVVADFTTRIGQLGNLAPSISQTLGLGAAMQELGLSAEIAAGGITNILLTASKATADFADQLGISEQQMKALINTNPNEFLLRLAQSLQNVPADQVAKRLDDLGISSQEAVKVMSLLKDQTELVRDKQLLANTAMQAGTSLTNEFNIKNQTSAAELDKQQKALDAVKVELGIGLLPAYTRVLQTGALVLNLLMDFPQWLNENRTAVGLLAVGLVTLNTNLIAAQAATLAKSAADRAAAIASGLASAAEAVRARETAAAAIADRAATVSSQALTLQQRLQAVQTAATSVANTVATAATNAWTVAQGALNMALRTNPIGLIITAVAALAAGVVLAYQKSETFRGIVNGLWAAVRVGIDVLGDVYDWTVKLLRQAFEPVYDMLATNLRPALSSLWSVLSSGASIIADIHSAIFRFGAVALGGLWEFLGPVRQSLGELWDTILGGVQVIQRAASAIADFLHIDEIVTKAKTTANRMGSEFMTAYNAEMNKGRKKDEDDHDDHLGKKGNATKATNTTLGAHAVATNATALNTIGDHNENHRKQEEQRAKEKAEREKEERVKANAEASDQIKQKNIELIQDEQTRKLAQLAFERDQERARIAESKADKTLKLQQMDLAERAYEQAVEQTRKEYRDRQRAAEQEAMQAYVQMKTEQAQAERTLFSELQQYRMQTVNTNLDLELNRTTTTEQRKSEIRRQQTEQTYQNTLASINQEYADKVSEIQRNVQDNDARMRAIKDLNDWKLAKLKEAETTHTASLKQLHDQDLQQRREKSQEYFTALDGLMRGDYNAFTTLLNKRFANERAANQAGLQNFAAKGQETLQVAAQVVNLLQTLNQKYLESQLSKIAKEKTAQLASWQDQYQKGKISKDEYESKVSETEKEFAEKKKAEQLKAWKREQTMNIAMAIINGAMAALKSLATLGWPLGLIGVAASAVAAGIQIALIKRQQPPSFASGGVVSAMIPEGSAHGSRFGEGGISLIDNKTGKHKGEIEGGEPLLVLSKNTYGNNKPIIDALLHSSLHRRGAAIFRDGGLTNDGGDYGYYLGKRFDNGGLVEFDAGGSGGGSSDGGRPASSYGSGGQPGEDGGGSSGGLSIDDAGGSSGSASEIEAITNSEIEKSQALMEKIGENTEATAKNLELLTTYLGGAFGQMLTNNTADVMRAIALAAQNQMELMDIRGNRLETKVQELATLQAQGAGTRHDALMQDLSTTRSELLRALTGSDQSQSQRDQADQQAADTRHSELMQFMQQVSNAMMQFDTEQANGFRTLLESQHQARTLASGQRHAESLTELRSQIDKLIASDQALARNDSDVFERVSADQMAAQAEQHRALVTALQSLSQTELLAMGLQHVALMNRLQANSTAEMLADEARILALRGAVVTALRAILDADTAGRSAEASARSAQTSALQTAVGNLQTAVVNATNSQSGSLGGKLDQSNGYLNTIAGKQWSVSVHNVVNVTATVQAVANQSNL